MNTVVMEAEEKYKKFLNEIMVAKRGEACLDPCQENEGRFLLWCLTRLTISSL